MIEYIKLKREDCNFFFYSKSGSYGMFSQQVRKKFFCIPYICGVVRVESWGRNSNGKN